MAEKNVPQKFLKIIFFASAAVVGTLLAVSAVRKKGELLKTNLKKALGNAKRKIKVNKDGLNDRQKLILSFFTREEKVTIEMIKNEIKDVTERTLRRDMDFLEKKKYIKKVGETKGTYYQLCD